jgi:restriction system protein
MPSEERMRDLLREEMRAITDRQFEQLCKIVLTEVEGVERAELTPKSGDGGIDVIGHVGTGLYRVTMGIQAKQYSKDINGTSIRAFSGALGTQGHKWGVFVTTSGYNRGAVEEAQEHPVQLIDGEEFASIMMENGVGVTAGGQGEYALDQEFWSIFDLTTEGGNTIPSEEVPQANDLGVLPVVLEGIDSGYRYKPDIVSYMKMKTTDDWRTRQGDYYAHAGWILGYVHKDTIGEYNGKPMRKWGLTRAGQRIMSEVQEAESNDPLEIEIVREDFKSKLREVEIIRRLLDALREAGAMERSELASVVVQETELSEVTARRRVSTMTNWMEELLPEVVRRHSDSGTRWEYIEKSLSDY